MRDLMKNEYQSETNYSIQILTLFVLLIVNTMVRSQFDILSTIGNLSINLTLILMFIYLIKGVINKNTFNVRLTNIYISIFLFVVIFSISFFVYDRVDIIYFLKLILFLMFILGTVRIRWSPKYIKIAAHLFGITLFFVFLHWVHLDFTDHRFKSIFHNPNYLGVFLFVMLYFKILAVKYGSKLERLYFLILIALNFILIYCTNSRAVMVAVAVVLLAWIFLKEFRKFFPYLFFVVVTLNIVFLITYVKLHNTSLGMFLNEISLKIIGKSFYSGRSVLWEEILQKVEEKPLFGYGLGVKASDITSFSLTAHNQYLQFMIEEGILGLVIFLLLLYSIWKLLIKRLDHYPSKLSACFFLGILIYVNFELTLFQNNYPIAFIQWLIIVIGINFESKTRSDVAVES
ncbi:O-antigen ligase family protein [Virgibacillus sp. NKC19-3]|uniref:O-antigen ligase family protein n=1 Tax=Virgibacillus saliphilus TaxID=2831674 RepID=UPI001C9B4324|nr:O-antigen ligase family protein [Virgibacillus sp. NKC19-3]MBY7144657.1 O-antigen ligase family protein [Virgibacillus sp. NKC19-3]